MGRRTAVGILVLTSVFASTGLASSRAQAADVLGPEAAPVVQRLGRVVAHALGCELGEVQIATTDARLTLRCPPPGGVMEVRLQPPGVETTKSQISTRHGTFTFPEGHIPVAGLGGTLEEVPVTVAWRAAAEAPPERRIYQVNPKDAAAVAVERVQASEVRNAPVVLDPGNVDSRLAPVHLVPGRLEPGDVSAWLSAGARGGPCPGPCMDEDVRPLLNSRSRVPSGKLLSWIRDLRGEPKLWAAAAGAAWREGDPAAAVAYADVATRLDPRDPDARRVWAQLTTGDGGDPQGAVLSDWIGDRPSLPPWAWLLFAAALWLSLAWRYRPDQKALVGVVIGVSLGALAYTFAPSEPEAPLPPPPVPDALVAPLAGGDCLGDPALWTGQGWEIYATCNGEPTVFSLGAPGVRVSSATPGTLQEAAQHHLEGLWSSIPEKASASSGSKPTAPVPLWSRRDMGEVALCAGIAGAAALALFWLQVLFARDLWRRAREDRALAICFAVAILITLVMHIGVPSRLVMTYTGYDLTARLGFLDTPPRYGAGASWLYAPWFSLLGIDHGAVQVANRWMGALTLLPVTALVMAVSGNARWATGFAALLFALLPVIWRDHTSEGIQTGTTWVLLSALAGWASVMTGRRGVDALLAIVPVAALAVVCRPEVGPALLVATVGLYFLRGSGDEAGSPVPPGVRDASVWLAVGGVLLAVVPHGAWLLQEVSRLVGEGGIAPLEVSLWDRVMHTLLQDNILISGPWAPGALCVWLLAGLLFRGENSLVCVSLGLAAFVWVAITSVDLPAVSIPRVHLPALMLVFPVLSVGVERLRALRFANAALGIWLGVSVLLGASAVLATGDEDVEEALIRAAVQYTAEKEDACVARMGFGDPPPPGRTQRHFPHYLFQGRRVLDLSEVKQSWDSCPGGVVAILGTRCYLTVREHGLQAPEATGAHAVCERLRDAYALTPVVEHQDTGSGPVGTYALGRP